MTVRIATALLDAVVAHAAAEPGREVCGLLFGSPGAIERAEACANVSDAPDRRFEIDPARLIAAHRAQRAGGLCLIGSYHSHPSGTASPSATDAAQAPADGSLWLIVAAGRARLWRAVAGGAVHGRFDPVPLEPVAAASCADAGASPQAHATLRAEDAKPL